MLLKLPVSLRPCISFSRNFHKLSAVVLFFTTLAVVSNRPNVVNEAAREQNMISYMEHEKVFFFMCKMVHRDQHENKEAI